MKSSWFSTFQNPRGVFFIVFCTVFYFQSWGQEPPAIIPPSPTAAALGKYGDIPVSLYTGIPNVDIPLYTLAGAHLKLPISLSYHAGGLKVEENSSWVGLGFSLNAGGVITRTTRGLRDEVTGQTKGYLTNDPIPVRPDMLNYFTEVITGHLDTEPDIFFFNFNGYSGKFFLEKGSLNSNVVKGFSIPYKDLDISCTYSSDVLSDFTIRTEDGTEYFFNTIESTTTRTYHYEANTAIPFITSDRTTTAISAWYLTEIRSPVGSPMEREKISFTYVPEKFRYDTPKRGEVGYRSNGQIEYRTMSYSENTVQGVRLTSIRFDKLKTSIEFNTEKERTDLISFATEKPMALEEIVVKHDNANIPVKKIKLVSSYFQNDLLDTNPLPIAASQHYQYRRLRLDQVIESSKDGLVNLPPYIFDYNTDMIPPKDAETQDHWGYYNGPKEVYNASQYYSNNYMIPAYEGGIDASRDRYLAYSFGPSCNTTSVDIPINLRSYQKVPGVSREPQSSSMQVGILKKITYPTGGTTEMEFEPHRYGYVSDKPYDIINYAKMIPNAVIERPWDTNPTQDETNTMEFTVAKTGLYRVNFSVEFAYTDEIKFNDGWAYNRNEVSLQGAGLPHPHVKIYWDNNDGLTGQPMSLHWEEGMSFPTTVPVTTLATGWVEYEGRVDDVFEGDGEHFGRRRATGFFVVKLRPDVTYTLTAMRKYDAGLYCPTNGTCYENNNEAAIFLDKDVQLGEIVSIDKQHVAGGLRIRKTTSLDGFGGKPLSTEYAYVETDVNQNDTDRSSGCLLSLPEHNKLEAWFIERNVPENVFHSLEPATALPLSCYTFERHVYTVLRISSDYPMPLSTTQGSHIGYREVRVRQVGNGSTITKFLSGYEHPDEYPRSIYFQAKETVGEEEVIEGQLIPEYETQYQGLLPKSNNDWMRGFVDAKITMSEDNFKLIEEKNHYTFQNKKTAEGIQVFWTSRSPVAPFLLLRIQYVRYNLVSGWGFLNNKVITEHTPSGEIVNNFIYGYNSNKHIQVTDQFHVNSENKTEHTSYIYVADKPSLPNTSTATLDLMIQKNMLYGLLSKEVRLDGTLVNGVINNYKVEEGNPVPSFVEVYENGYQERLTYNKYNPSGNLLQYTTSEKIPVSFIWDGTGSMPLAKVVSASSDRIFFNGFEENGTLQDENNRAKTGSRFLNSGSYNFSSDAGFNPPSPQSLKMSYWYWDVGNGWKFRETSFANVINEGTRLDEVRVYPEGAQMTTYSYEPLVGIISQTDANNVSQYYKYDKYNRLEFIRDEKGNILQKFTYHYSGE